ncbi:hypothetical protein MKX08_009871 [Trichoderma sp. CBMAI-0020]|nr:hypothetical protein MKX08_009871 [Trichoderma sp. CBMAI-0020]
MDDRPNLGKDEAMYDSSAKNSCKSTYRQNEAEMDVDPATSLSSDFKTADPYLSQQPEYEVWSSGRADGTASSSQRLYTHDLQDDITSRISPRQRAHDLADDVTTNTQGAPYNSHSIGEDIFWTGAQGPRTVQHAVMSGNGGESASKFSLEEAELGNLDSEIVGGSPPGKIATASQRTPLSRENSSTTGRQHESKYEPIENVEATHLLQKNTNSPARKAIGVSPKTPRRGLGATVESEGSLRKVVVANSTKSPKPNIESSDISTWKQQLRKVSDSRSNSPKKPYSPLAAGSQVHSSQSPTVLLQDEETTARSTREYGAETKEQTSRAQKQRGSINDGMESILTENDNTEPKIIVTAPDDDSEMPSSHHICEWRSRYLGLSAAFDKLQSELDVALQQANPGTGGQEPETASHHNRYNDYDIEGLTIIVHRRSREDLVLNTDLREEKFSDIGE